MKFDCTPAEFVELISNPLAAQLLAPLLEKVNTMSTTLENKFADLEAAFAAQAKALADEQAQSAGFRNTVLTQLVPTMDQLKAALEQAMAGNADTAAAPALIQRADALIASVQASTSAAQADTTADSAANQTASDTVAVNAPAA